MGRFAHFASNRPPFGGPASGDPKARGQGLGSVSHLEWRRHLISLPSTAEGLSQSARTRLERVLPPGRGSTVQRSAAQCSSGSVGRPSQRLVVASAWETGLQIKVSASQRLQQSPCQHLAGLELPRGLQKARA